MATREQRLKRKFGDEPPPGMLPSGKLNVVEGARKTLGRLLGDLEAVLAQQFWLVEKFDPNQPRGVSTPGTTPGSWISEGGGDTSHKAATDLLQHPTKTADEIIDSVPGARERAEEVRRRLAASVPTDATIEQGGHRLADGSWAPERAALHDRILNDVFTPQQIAAALPAEGEQPTVHVLGGRGGSGKSWFTDPERGGTVDATKAIMLNNDNFKEALPEYRGWNAALLHEESSHIGKTAEKFARDNRLNVIIDGTMRSDYHGKLAEWKAAGYRVEGHYMYLSPQQSAERAIGRFMRGGERGRYVPPEYSLTSTTNEKSFDGVKNEMDRWEIYDNSGRSPQLYARSRR